MLKKTLFTNYDIFAQKTISFEDCDFREFLFEEDVVFKGSFLGRANFKESIFKCFVDFSGATFSDGASFSGVSFQGAGDVIFEKVLFESLGDEFCETDFHDVVFANKGGVVFSDALFKTPSVNFENAYFACEGSVEFRGAKFESSTVSMEKVVFSCEHVSFYCAEFSNGGIVSFNSAVFANRGEVTFAHVTFKVKLYLKLSEMVFVNYGRVLFLGAEFMQLGHFSFRENIFLNKGKVDFSEIRFAPKQHIIIKECLFLNDGDILFEHMTASENGSLFIQRCHFDNTFGHISFNNARFWNAMFEGGIIEWIENASQGAKNCPIKNILISRGVVDCPLAEAVVPISTDVFPTFRHVYWKDISVESGKNLTFRLVNLSYSIFDGVTLSNVQLNAPKWFRIKDRNALNEEMLARNSYRITQNIKIYRDKIRNVENQYTQLKNNLEKQGNYLQAGDFHIGEQEMRWLNAEIGVFDSAISILYKTFSGYGERPWIAGKWLLRFLIFWPLLSIFIDGIFIDSCSSISYGLAMGLYFKSFIWLITPFSWKEIRWDFLSHCEQESLNFWLTTAIIILGQIILYIQLPLFIMAVRRRFKR